MPKRCSCCEHPQRVEIDAALLQGGTSRAVGQRFGLSKPTITGHRRSGHHLLQTPRQGAGGPHNAESLLTRIEDLRGDDEAMRSLRLAVSTLPPGERRRLVEGLRLRAGRGEVEQPVSARMAAAS